MIPVHYRRSECELHQYDISRRCFELTCWCLWRDPPQTRRVTLRVDSWRRRREGEEKGDKQGRSIVGSVSLTGLREESSFPMSIWRRCHERPNLNLISVLEGRYRIEETVSTFLHPPPCPIVAKGCVFYVYGLLVVSNGSWNVQVSFTNSCARLYTACRYRILFLHTSLTRNIHKFVHMPNCFRKCLEMGKVRSRVRNVYMFEKANMALLTFFFLRHSMANNNNNVYFIVRENWV